MSRPFEFTPRIKKAARLRQFGRCGCCGDRLEDIEESAHHVVPNQSGHRDNPAHAWIGGVDNCVIVCHICHDRVHEDGKTRYGLTAPPSYFRFSHGPELGEHRVWLHKMNAKITALWP